MDLSQVIAGVVFLVSIFLVITGWVDSVLAALGGIILMVLLGIMTDIQAFQMVDWNVIVILLSIWIISGYFGKSGVPDYLAAVILKMSKGNVAIFMTLIGALAGFVSMLIDNVVVVLMFTPVVFHQLRALAAKVRARIAIEPTFPISALDVRPKEEGLIQYGIIVRGVVYNKNAIGPIQEAAREICGDVPVEFALQYRWHPRLGEWHFK